MSVPFPLIQFWRNNLTTRGEIDECHYSLMGLRGVQKQLPNLHLLHQMTTKNKHIFAQAQE